MSIGDFTIICVKISISGIFNIIETYSYVTQPINNVLYHVLLCENRSEDLCHRQKGRVTMPDYQSFGKALLVYGTHLFTWMTSAGKCSNSILACSMFTVDITAVVNVILTQISFITCNGCKHVISMVKWHGVYLAPVGL